MPNQTLAPLALPARTTSRPTMNKSAQNTVITIALALFLLHAIVPYFQGSLIINTTSSQPRGLYHRTPLVVEKGALISVQLPSRIQTFMAERKWIAPSMQSLKRIIALPGDTITCSGDTFEINHVPFGKIATVDSLGRSLPQFFSAANTPFTVPPDTVLLGSTHHRSFDSRYYGPVPISCLLSGAEPILTWEEDTP